MRRPPVAHTGQAAAHDLHHLSQLCMRMAATAWLPRAPMRHTPHLSRRHRRGCSALALLSHVGWLPPRTGCLDMSEAAGERSAGVLGQWSSLQKRVARQKPGLSAPRAV
jgi:hypothetical protein